MKKRTKSRREAATTKRHLVGNSWADKLAKEGRRAHAINQEEYDRADDRAFLAAVVQHMIKEIWAAHFQIDYAAQRSGDFGNQDDKEEEEGEDRRHETPAEENLEDTPFVIKLPPEEEDPWVAEEEAAKWLQEDTAPPPKQQNAQQKGATRAQCSRRRRTHSTKRWTKL